MCPYTMVLHEVWVACLTYNAKYPVKLFCRETQKNPIKFTSYLER